MNVSDLLRRQASARPHAPAYTCANETLSWSEVDARVSRLADRLASSLRAGDRVAILSRTCHRYFETHYALARAGLVAVPLNSRLTGAELAALLEDSGASALVLDRALERSAEEAMDALGSAAALLVIRHGEIDGGVPDAVGEDYETIVAVPGAADPTVEVADGDLHVIGYTSGTTGTTKGAMITHHSATISALAYAISLELTSDDRVLACMPGYVYRGGSAGFAPAVAGAHTVVTEFAPARVLELIDRYDITQVTLAPAMASRVLDLASSDTTKGTRLRRIWLTGAPAAASMIEALAARFKTVVGCLYGMTEATGIAMIAHSPDRPDLLSSIGRPMLLLDVRLLDDDGRKVELGDIGEIVVRGDTVTPGYWGDPVLTERVLRDGWLHTGDLATCDADGNLFIVDRRADIINSGGLNIYTSQVETAILSHPDVVDCTVVGAPDESWGEVPVAVVVSRRDVSEADVIEWVGSSLASFKKPRRVEFVSELPRNAMGKVDKRAVRDPYWRGRSRKVGG